AGPGIHLHSFSPNPDLGLVTGYQILGNLIGTDATGTSPVGNGGDGILIDAGGVNNTIGGPDPGAGNVIAYNQGNGVTAVGVSVGNVIRGNSIFNNDGLGIDLGGDGVTPNDPLDADPGPNGLQNFPVITSASGDGGQTVVQGTLNSTPGTTFTLDFY